MKRLNFRLLNNNNPVVKSWLLKTNHSTTVPNTYIMNNTLYVEQSYFLFGLVNVMSTLTAYICTIGMLWT